jgi:hypothetical protein
VTNLSDASKSWDAICIIDATDNDAVTSKISEIRMHDEAVTSEVSCFTCSGYGCRIIYSPMGELTDFDDVRAYAEAAKKAIRRALKAGAKAPVLCLPKTNRFENADLVALLGALAELYVVSTAKDSLKVSKLDASSLHSLSNTVRPCRPTNSASLKSACITRTPLACRNS